MPSLAQSLEGQDLGHLRMVAEIWGLELKAQNAREAIEALSSTVPNSELVEEVVEALPAQARQALSELCAEAGRLPWAQFARAYGEVRSLGAARREKEAPHRNPANSSERLWYRALIARAFFDSPDGPLEYAYIPDDLLPLIPVEDSANEEVLGRPARPEERRLVEPTDDQILDESCSLLAALRMGKDMAELAGQERWQAAPSVLLALLQATNVVGADGQPDPDNTREFLEAERGAALALLVTAWQQSRTFNELRLMPGLSAEGNWSNDPLHTRQRILAFLRSAPQGEWWSLPALVDDVKQEQPDFQRPAGDYDSWYLRSEESGDYLRGFEHWEVVDGGLIRFVVEIMHWLGVLDIARNEDGGGITAFRFSAWASDLMSGEGPNGLAEEGGRLNVDSQGQVQAPALVSRAVRYQVARFCQWEGLKKELYRYRVNARSLGDARKRGLEVRQLIGLLKKHCDGPLPPNLLQALQRWDKQGTEARLGRMLVLRMSSAAALKAVQASRAARYLGEPLGPTSIAVKEGAGPQVLRALAELGYLGELEEDDDGLD